MTEQTTLIQEATLWSDERWTARVMLPFIVAGLLLRGRTSEGGEH